MTCVSRYFRVVDISRTSQLSFVRIKSVNLALWCQNVLLPNTIVKVRILLGYNGGPFVFSTIPSLTYSATSRKSTVRSACL